MIHIEITRDGESVLSRDFENDKVHISEYRPVSALYKNKEDMCFALAPSAKSRLTITADSFCILSNTEIYTKNESVHTIIHFQET